jgi:hypothetical protein
MCALWHHFLNNSNTASLQCCAWEHLLVMFEEKREFLLNVMRTEKMAWEKVLGFVVVSIGMFGMYIIFSAMGLFP